MEQAKSRESRVRHWQMFGLACAVAVFAATLQVLPDQRVAFSAWPDYPMPATCTSYAWFGVKCPGCGLTRSFIYLAHGRWDASLEVHRLGWLLALSLAAQIPYRALCLWSHDRYRLSPSVSKAFGLMLITALFVNWMIDFFH